MSPNELCAHLWRDYVATTPQAQRIHDLLEQRGETVHNDHVALRSFGVDGLGMTALAQPFERAGWRPRESYRFGDKHLRARYWQHPETELPKVFISELVVEELSAEAQALIAGLVAQVPAGLAERADLPWSGRPWRLTRASYEQLLGESEYAAWVAAFGFRVNHFTVDVRRLRSFESLPALCAFLEASGFALNASGGVIKGSAADYLEQASTLADLIEVELDDGVARLPSCYYELALRHVLPNGEMFHGFIPASANKIFESTDVAQQR